MKRKNIIYVLIVIIGLIGVILFSMMFGNILKITYKDNNNLQSDPEIIYKNTEGNIRLIYLPYYLNKQYDEIHLQFSDSVKTYIKSLSTKVYIGSQEVILKQVTLIPSRYLAETDAITFSNTDEIEKNESLHKYHYKIKLPITKGKLPEKFDLELSVSIWDYGRKKTYLIQRNIEVEQGIELAYHGIYMK